MKVKGGDIEKEMASDGIYKYDPISGRKNSIK